MNQVSESRGRWAGPRRGLLGTVATLAVVAGSLTVAQPAWAAPTALTSVDAVVPGELSLTANWTTAAAPTPTDRVIAKAYDPLAPTVVAATCQKFAVENAQSCVLKGLKAATVYDVTVEVRSNTNVEVVAAAPASAGAPLERTVAAPEPPANVVADATGASGEVEVFWEAGESPNAVLSGYTATAVDGGVPTTKTCTTADATETSCKISGLTNGTEYTVTVVATGANDTGNSAASAPSAGVTPGIKPAAPTDVVARASTPTTAEVHWTASTSDGIDTYTVTAYTLPDNPVSGLTCVPTVIPGNLNMVGCITSSDLLPGVEHYFTVTATSTNEQTSDAATSNNILPTAAPAAPTGGEVEVGDGELTVSWTAPTSTPATIGSYRVLGHSATPDAVSPVECIASTGTSCTLTGLTNDADYSLWVAAVSAAGTGTDSLPLVLAGPYTPAEVPKPATPTGVTLDPTDTTIVVTWEAPAAATADAPVTATHYTATAEPGGEVCATVNASVHTCTITGLTPETEYTVSVVAKGVNADSVAATDTTTTLPAPPSGGDGPGDLTGPIVVDKDGNSRIFVRGGGVESRLWTAVRNGDGEWTEWETLGYPLYSEPVAVRNTDGSVQVFVLDANGYVTYKRQMDDGSFGEWTRISTNMSLANIALATNADGKVVVFGRNGDRLVYSVQTTGPDAWSSWVDLGYPISGIPTVATMADGRLEVFVTGFQNAVYRRAQKEVNASASDSDWTGWERVAPASAASVFM